MKIRHALIGGFGGTLVAVLGVVLMAFLMLSQFAASWTEMSTVIASRHQVMLSGTLRLGYATEHFNNYLREGGDFNPLCLSLHVVASAPRARQLNPRHDVERI